jgi:feruloyl esterase
MNLRKGSLAGLGFLIVIGGGWPASRLRAQDTAAPTTSHAECASLSSVAIPGAKITEAVAVAAPSMGVVKVAHCRVSGVIDTETHFTALLPDRWNERFFSGGGSGFGGSVENQAQAAANTGYATIGTDTGHQGSPIEASWALNNKERVTSFGYQAIHRMTEVGKAVTKAYYRADPKYSYFYGCSNGGREALMEAQRFAADYDGVVACAPWLDITNIAAEYIKNSQAAFPNPKTLTESTISPENLKLVETKVLDACDAEDGVKDGIIGDPRECKFKIADLAPCIDDKPAATCVTKAQRTALDKVFSPTMSRTAAIYPAQPFGAESDSFGLRLWAIGANPQLLGPMGNGPPSLQFAYGTEFFKYLVFGKEDWDYSKYMLATWAADTHALAGILNADNPDLTAFKARKGKLILAHGWADPAVNPLSTIAYYDKLQSRDAGVRDYVRLFMMPGVLHCAGGPGPDTVDWFAPIADWVEHDHAPDSVVAKKVASDGSSLNTRPLCAYPGHATYNWSGSSTDLASYSCDAK